MSQVTLKSLIDIKSKKKKKIKKGGGLLFIVKVIYLLRKMI